MSLLAVEIVGHVQNYDWGKIGKESKVFQLANVQQEIPSSEHSKPFAELWMGTHVSGPSKLKHNPNQSLKQFLQEHPSFLSSEEASTSSGDVPFLFKVLSVNQALSIQCHPNKSHAEELFQKFPKIYKDGNHKPELACALTPFEALCAFRKWDKIVELIQTTPELKQLLEIQLPDLNTLLATSSQETKLTTLKIIFSALMKSKEEEVASYLSQLQQRLQDLPQQSTLQQLVLRLCSQYPNDVGIFAAYFLNYVELQPGEGLFLGPNEPHAYLSGDCIECMACSDNVVRAGLTPKYRDVETLCEMLTYKDDSLEKMFMKGEEVVNRTVFTYSPPKEFPEFKLFRVEFSSTTQSCKFELKSIAIALVTKGKATLTLKRGEEKQTISLETGSIFAVATDTEMQLSGSEDFQCYINSCNKE